MASTTKQTGQIKKRLGRPKNTIKVIPKNPNVKKRKFLNFAQIPYDQEMGEYICYLTATNNVGLSKLCEMYPELPDERVIKGWLFNLNDTFGEIYARAKKHQVEQFALELMHEAEVESYYENGIKRVDSGVVAAARLKIDSGKWLAAKLCPRLYGEKAFIDIKKIDDEAVMAEINAIRATLEANNKNDY